MTVITTAGISTSFAHVWTGTSVVESPGGQYDQAQRGNEAIHRFAALGEMTGGIAHDFGNVIAVIDASLRLLERNIDQPEKMLSMIEAARGALGRGAKLTSQLMAFAKRQPFHVECGDVNACLENLAAMLRYSVGPSYPIVLDLEPGLPLCRLDSTQFDVAVLNLVVNARDAMLAVGGEIHIKTARYLTDSALYVMVSVEDQGAGMSPQVIEKIFDPFFTTKGECGTGLGLVQVHATMNLVGGYVNVSSDPGRGTVVDLVFPIAETDDIEVQRGGREA
jgi:signal transduction histidine kinase